MKTPFTLLFLTLGFGAFSQWVQKSNLPSTGRNHPVTFAINGTGYLATGGSDGAPFNYDDMWKYDPVNDSWSPVGNMPGGDRSFAYGVAVGGFGYAGFGANISGNATYLNDWYRFDPVSETWTTLATFPGTPRTHPAMVATSTKIYVGLGGSAGGDLDDWWEYDIATDTWTQRTDFPSTRRHHPFYFNVGDDVYVGMGHHQSSIFNDLYHYDITNDTWTQMASLPGEGRVAGTQFTYNDRGYVLSGQGEDHLNLGTGEMWEYNPVTDSWAQLPPHPGTGRWAPGSFVIGDSIFLVCGQTDDIQPDQRDLWMLDFQEIASAEELETLTLSVYPNPVDDILYLNANEMFESVRVSNVMGEVMFEAEGQVSEIDVSAWKSGVYFIVVSSGIESKTKRFVKN